MRRELKVLKGPTGEGGGFRHKAYPDEKGTESPTAQKIELLLEARHKAYPDEKGTERSLT